MASSIATPAFFPKSSERAVEAAVELRGVSKRFYYYEHRTSSLREWFIRRVLRRPLHIRRAEFTLRDFNLRIAPGQTVAFVGRTGSGKSTLINLIPRIIDAPPGTVLVDGVSVRDYRLAKLRSCIGYVPQETFLFSETLSENIAFGVEHAERRQIEWAADVAGLM